MNTLKKIIVLITTVLLLSCEKDENNINMSKLLDYDFMYTSHSVITNMSDEIVENKYDTTVYSFSPDNRVIAMKKVVETIENIVQLDTITETYTIDDEYVNFSSSDSRYDYLLAYYWEVVSITDEYLKIKLNGPNGYSGDEQLLCIKK